MRDRDEVEKEKMTMRLVGHLKDRGEKKCVCGGGDMHQEWREKERGGGRKLSGPHMDNGRSREELGKRKRMCRQERYRGRGKVEGKWSRND